jgi:hypothetical protein
MTSPQDWRARRAFQQWSIVALGILITAVALLGDSSDVNVPMNAALLSFVLLSSTGFELVGLHRWQDTCEFLCGIWSAASPFAFGYAEAGQLRYWHVASGALLMLLASFNFWKD